MPKDGLTGTPFENPVVPTASGGDGTTLGQTGGAPWPMEDNSKSGLVSSPYDAPACTPPGGMETANSSGLNKLPYTTAVKDGPAPNTQIGVEPGVASPAVAITPIA